MGRKLPWTRADDEPLLPTIKNESPRITKRKSPDSSSTPSRPKRVAKASHSAFSNRAKSPSTSPPPEPPKQESMRTDDDRYRIVEDEFLHTAKKFTAHLHRAEYQRLKTLAASQHAHTIRAIERPVVGPATRVTKQRAELARKNAKQRTLTGEKEVPSTGLMGLMASPRKEERSLRLGKPTMGTRAAAGFGSQESPSRQAREPLVSRSARSRAPSFQPQRQQTPSRQKGVVPPRRSRGQTADEDTDIDTTDEDSDGHLGSTETSRRLSAKPTATPRASTFQPPRDTTSNPAITINRAKSAPNLKQRAQPKPVSTPAQTIGIKDDDDDDDDDPFGIQKRRIHRAKSRDQMRQSTAKESVDLIPSFL